MAQSMYTLDNITYVAGRHYVHDGVSYEPGDVVENAREFRNVEAMVRSRHLIPVVKDHNDVPVYFQKDVKPAALVEEKYRFSIKWPSDSDGTEDEDGEDEETDEENDEEEVEEEAEEAFHPADHTIPEVLDYLDSHPDELDRVIAEEKASDKPRSTLLDKIEVTDV